MVMGHIGFGGHFDKFIHAFHMPMFFIVSGMFFRVKDKPSVFIKKKAKSLLLPYAVFGLFHYGVWALQNWSEVSFTPLLHLLWINTDDLPIAGALWFLTALFFSEVLYYLIRRYITGGVFQHVVVFVVALSGCVATTVLPFRLPYALDAAFVGVGLMHIGYLYKKHYEKLNRIEELQVYEFFILGITATVLIFVNGYINMRSGSYAIIPLFWINTVLATVVGINLAKYLVRFAPDFLRYYLSSVGRNSIVYLCLNQLVILIATHFIQLLISVAFLSKIITLVVSLSLLVVLERLLTRTRFRTLIGK